MIQRFLVYAWPGEKANASLRLSVCGDIAPDRGAAFGDLAGGGVSAEPHPGGFQNSGQPSALQFSAIRDQQWGRGFHRFSTTKNPKHTKTYPSTDCPARVAVATKLRRNPKNHSLPAAAGSHGFTRIFKHETHEREVPGWGWAQGFSRSGGADIAGCTAARATFRPGGRGKLLIISADTYMLGKHEINRAATFRRPHVPGIFGSHPAADIASAAGG